MNFEQYSENSYLIIQSAQMIAMRESNPQLMPEHLLKALIEDKNQVVNDILNESKFSPHLILIDTIKLIAKLPQTTDQAEQPIISKNLLKIFDKAKDKTKSWQSDTIKEEHMMMSLIDTDDITTGQLLKKAGLTRSKFDAALLEYQKSHKSEQIKQNKSAEILKKYTRDLTEDAKLNLLSPVIGRDEDILRTIQILSRKTKNNPVLIGEPGVGKTAIVEGLALRIASGDIPEGLKNKKILSLDLGGMISGAKYRGEFEERLKLVIQEVIQSNGQIIMFVDEMHNLIGAGKGEGSIDAANLLKPALARGELHCIGATTTHEYHLYVEKDAALSRRFQPITIAEPSIDDTVSILRGLKRKYEIFHGVSIRDQSLIAAVKLSSRYITDRFLPDKAIDLVDEACSRMKMEINSKPEELELLDRHIIQLRIERSALMDEKDEFSIDRLKDLKIELIDLEIKSGNLTTEWNNQKTDLIKGNQIKKNIEDTKLAIVNAQRSGQYELAGELTYDKIPKFEKELLDFEHEDPNRPKLVNSAVSPNDIAHVISVWTGIPLEKMLENEEDKFLNIESKLREKIIGQDDAINSVANIIRCARAGLQDPNKPIGSLIFLGPTGVGKTELAKVIAEFMFDKTDALTRIDMSEYMEKHTVSRIIGAPPGYIGYDEGGGLTEIVRRRPYQVILLDEIEKAHPDVLNILLQVMDAGRLTDSQGHIVNFKNTLIIMTSNIGSDLISEQNLKTDQIQLRQIVLSTLKKYFKSEFLNRIDDIILFNQLNKTDMIKILDNQIHSINLLLHDRSIQIQLNQAAKEWLIDKGYDPAFGARPLNRTIKRYIQDPLAKMIISKKIIKDDNVYITTEVGSLSFNGHSSVIL